MKKLIILLISIIFFNSLPALANGFWNKVWDEIMFETTRSRKPSVKMNKIPNIEEKIYRIGSDDVYYSTLNPAKIERIGNKVVEYKMVNNEILKIGNDFVTYSTSGKILKVGEKEVFYKGNKIIRIGNDEVLYK